MAKFVCQGNSWKSINNHVTTGGFFFSIFAGFFSRSTKENIRKLFPVKKITSVLIWKKKTEPEKEKDHSERPLDRQMFLQYPSRTAMLSL